MSAYLDPFAQIVDLHKPPSVGDAVLIAEFANAPTQGYVSPPSGFTQQYQTRYDGETWIWLVPAYTGLSFIQKSRLCRPLIYNTIAPGWVGLSPSNVVAYFATREGAIAYSLGVTTADVQRKVKLLNCLAQQDILYVTGSFTEVRHDYTFTDTPYNGTVQGAILYNPRVDSSLGQTVNATPAAFDATFPGNASYMSTGVGVLLTSMYTQVNYNPSSTLETDLAQASGTAYAGSSVSGQTVYNSQLAAAASVAGSYSYP